MTTDAVRSSGRDPVIRAGGLLLILGAIAFMAVFSYLAARFKYPEVLDGAAADVLPALLATGNAGRAAWALYALLPLVWIPAAVGAFHALRPKSEGSMRIGVMFATVSSLAMMLGLMRWPSFHWELAKSWAAADATTRPALEALFNSTNAYLGNYIGEFLGELAINGFFLLAAIAILRAGSGFPRWVGWLGVVASVAGMIAMFRNVTTAVAGIASINNYMLPLWMIVLGASLMLYRRVPAGVE
jgi:hypothetical protein